LLIPFLFCFIFHQFKANGQPAEFPFINGNFKVFKDFGSVHVIHDAGLIVSCKPLHNFCLFHVSGYYFGKTRGLLGTLDYEPWDDFKLPNGQVSLLLGLYIGL
jgi:hypothetical protein